MSELLNILFSLRLPVIENQLTDVPTENVLAILTMRIKMYALGVNCPTSPLLNLDIFIFAEVIQIQDDCECGFVLTMENIYLKLGVTAEILNKLIQVTSAVTMHVQCVVYICLSQKQHPAADRIQNESRNRTTISLFVNHFNKTILYALSEKLEKLRHANEQPGEQSY